MTNAPRSDTDDLITELVKDHDEARTIFTRLREGGAAGAEREDLVGQMIFKIVKHSIAEEAHLYPLVREALPEGDRIAEHELSEHAEVEEALKALEQLDPADPRYQVEIDKVIDEVRHHAQDEEENIFPQLRATCPPEQLLELGEKARATKKAGPTHPHPSAPDTPPGNKIAGPLAGIVDRLRDSISH